MSRWMSEICKILVESIIGTVLIESMIGTMEKLDSIQNSCIDAILSLTAIQFLFWIGGGNVLNLTKSYLIAN